MKATRKCSFCGKSFVTRSLQSRPANHGDTASGVSHLFQSSHTHGLFVTTRMQKTKQIVNNPISDEAYGLLGERLLRAGFNRSLCF